MAKTRDGFMASNTEHGSYSLFFLGQNILWGFVGLIGTFLTDIGLTAEKVAIILIAPKIWDAINDTLFGYLIDRIKPIHGNKFLPWIRIGVAMVGVTTIAIFGISSTSSDTVKIVWFLIAYILFDCAYTMLDAPTFALTTVMTSNITERTSIIAGGKLWAMVGAMFATIIIPILRPRLGWFMSCLILVIISVLFMIPLLFICKERHSKATKKDEQVTFKQMLNYLRKNKYLLFLLVAMLIIGITNIESLLAIVLARVCFHNESFATIISLCVAVPVILVSVAIPTLTKKWDKFNVLVGGMTFSIIMGITSYLIGYSNPAISSIFLALKCVGLSFYTVICYMLVADTVEYGTYATGTRAAGISFSLQTFVAKLKNALINSLAFTALGFFGYVSGENVVQPDGVAQGVWAVFNLLPAIGYTIAIILLLIFYKLRDKDVQIMAGFNDGTISTEEATNKLKDKYGKPAITKEVK